jgi:hypothetical protein
MVSTGADSDNRAKKGGDSEQPQYFGFDMNGALLRALLRTVFDKQDSWKGGNHV